MMSNESRVCHAKAIEKVLESKVFRAIQRIMSSDYLEFQIFWTPKGGDSINVYVFEQLFLEEVLIGNWDR